MSCYGFRRWMVVLTVGLLSAVCANGLAEEQAPPLPAWADLKMPVRSGLWLWLDAATEQESRLNHGQQPLAAGQDVDLWHDLSGHMRDVYQRTREARPTWDESDGIPSLRFDGDDFLMASAAGHPELKEATVLIVAAPDSNDGRFNAFLSFNDRGEDDFQTGFNVDLGGTPSPSWSTLNIEGRGQPGATNLMTADVPFGGFHVVSVRTRPGRGGTEVRFDGVVQKSRDRGEGAIAAEEITIGARFNRFGVKPGPTPFVQQFLKGRIASILVFDRVVNDSDLDRLERHLLGKFTPANHDAAAVRRVGRPAVPDDAPLAQMLVPGFTVRELPADLTNINNVEFSADGRLFAAGYDGRLHLLADTDGDGLEDHVTTFLDEKSEDYPLGIAVRGKSLYVVRRHRVAKHDDTDGDGIPDQVETAAEWEDASVPKAFQDARRVSGGLGLAIGSDGSVYTSTGSLNTFNAYMLEGADGKPVKPESVGDQRVKSLYDLQQTAGTVMRFTPGTEQPEIVATGVRYLMSMQFNRHGDLFATEQEGATWLANGNPFDELLHIQAARHYGFPPRHPKYLPAVVDEPSVFDFAPQHQSTCGFRFNESTEVRKSWGPMFWEGDAIVTGESRGKLFRTKLARSSNGYVAKNQVIGCLQMLPVDVAISPKGDLVIACHSGEPDWGTGPGGEGKLFKISYDAPNAPQPVIAWAVSPTETCIEFDKPLDPREWVTLLTDTRIEGGAHVAAGDRFERLRPGYAVVQRQSTAPRTLYPVLSAAIGENGRSIILHTPARTQAESFSIQLPFPAAAGDDARLRLSRSGGIDIGMDLTGVEASWSPPNGDVEWSGWLPHVDWAVASELTAASEPHQRLRELVQRPGLLTLKGQLDLSSMLHPAVQPGSALDYEYPPETVTTVFEAASQLQMELPGFGQKVSKTANATTFTITNPASQTVPFMLTVATGGSSFVLKAHWSTADDVRPRAFALRRILLPWVTTQDGKPSEGAAEIPEIAGGDWKAGRQLFFGSKLNCAGCHTIRGEGGKIAPELTNLIHRDYASVTKDIRRPNAAINPDFLSYAIETKDGRVLTGVLNGSTEAELSIGGTDGKITRLPRGDAESIHPSRTSIMPEKLLDSLTDEQVCDLMTFLLTNPAH